MRASVAQRAVGLVLNAHAAIPRRDRDRLEAILTNCVRHGPASQDRAGHADFRAHLRGRVAQVARVQPRAGAKLLALFERIRWPEPARPAAATDQDRARRDRES